MFRTHGLTGDPTFKAWKSMRERCLTSTRHDFARYGGRGIAVCARWSESFERFLVDMGPRPSNKHSLDRINNDGNYEPGNCRWATWSQQARNRSTNRLIEIDGITRTRAEWSEISGVIGTTISARIAAGFSGYELLAKSHRRYGQRHNLAKLKEREVIDIKAALASGANRRTLAAKYSVSISQIARIAIGRQWGFV